MPVDGTKFDRRALNRRADAHETRMAYTHDPVGNLVGESVTTYTGSSTAVATRGWVYDPFGRLVRTTGLVVEDVPLHATRYRYNGLGMRIMWQDDADADGTLESSERYYIMNDERWRPVATFRDQDEHAKEAFVWHAAGAAGLGGSSYIDSVILRDRDNTACGESCEPWRQEADGTLEERRFYCQNWRADVVAVTKSDGTPVEYVRYSAYGEATVHPVADLNMDGVVTSADLQAWTDLKAGGSSASAFGLDLDFDDYYGPGEGDEDLFWESYDANLGLSGRGRVSTPGVASRIGYAGYQWDQTAGAYHVRYRVYLPEIGRWTRRDPIGYRSHPNLYANVFCAPFAYTDPTGMVAWLAMPTWPPELQPDFIGPSRPTFKAIQQRFPSCPPRPKRGDPDEFWKVINPPHSIFGVTYCKNGMPTACYNWPEIRAALRPTRDDPGAMGTPRHPGWWQINAQDRERLIDYALGLVAACIVEHEQHHVTDAICADSIGVTPVRGYHSGSRGASERGAYQGEADCLSRAYVLCGDDPICKATVQNAMRSWNGMAATREGAERCGMGDPLDELLPPK
jgi:RHS repeat-associated protein